jgi:DNA replication protein DnaC
MSETNPQTATLTERMESLGLSSMAANFESFLSDQARNQMNLVDSIKDLIDLEYFARKERTARTRLKLSGMPHVKSFEDFDLSWLKGGMTRENIEGLKALSFVERKENVLLLGPSGVGKTHLLLSIGQKACLSGYTAYYLSCRDAVESLVKAREQNRLKKRLNWLKKPHVLLLDEVGYEPLTPEQAHVFFQLINARYETGTIVMTSNKPFSKWAELMTDEAIATAILDRLLHHALVFSLKADSFRMKDRLRVGTQTSVGGYGFD